MTDATPGFDLSGESTSVLALSKQMLGSRELLVILARKEFFMRYRRTTFGIAWAVALPLVQALVLAYVLRRFIAFPTVTQYPVFVYSGMVAWSFLSASVSAACTSIVDNSSITSRIYFPRALMPLMSVLSGLYGLVASTVVLLVLALVTGANLGVDLLLLLPATVLAVALASAFGLWTAAAQVYFRDVKFLVGATLLPMFYATPVFYPYERTSGTLRTLVTLNPASGVVQLFRLGIGEPRIDLDPVIMTVLWTVAIAAIGITMQARHDRVFADRL